MQLYEFMVVPAPKRGVKSRSARTTEDRFALALTMLMNEFGAEGWDYVRSDALPCEERAGFTGTKTTFQNVLVFRRPLGEAEANTPAHTPAPLRLTAEPEGPAAPIRPLGPAEAPQSVTAPVLGSALGSAKAELAAE